MAKFIIILPKQRRKCHRVQNRFKSKVKYFYTNQREYFENYEKHSRTVYVRNKYLLYVIRLYNTIVTNLIDSRCVYALVNCHNTNVVYYSYKRRLAMYIKINGRFKFTTWLIVFFSSNFAHNGRLLLSKNKN